MMSESTMRPPIRFPHLSVEAFLSKTDQIALKNLQRIPMLPQLVRKFNELALDRVMYAQNSAESVRCGPKQFKTVYNLMREACSILHIPEPELYVKASESYNAYTSGMDRTFIVLHSALVEDFTDEEILYILGHEVGHIKCGHVLYSMIGRMLIPLVEMVGHYTLGAGQVISLPVVMAFYEWMRQAEFSCDRAGLLTCQDPTVAFTTTMKLACGHTRFHEEMNVEAFLEQARKHAEGPGMEGATKTLLFLMYNWQLDHPQVVYRAKALDEWVSNGAYQNILSGNYKRDVTGGHQLGPQVTCQGCRTTVSTTIKFCPKCGGDLRPQFDLPPVVYSCTGCGVALPANTRFCPDCGKPPES
jgi:Zn-dependent protease with chaperone function/RNA polymerase subunit RPABC4/transcription elongation factor Spt4